MKDPKRKLPSQNQVFLGTSNKFDLTQLNPPPLTIIPDSHQILNSTDLNLTIPLKKPSESHKAFPSHLNSQTNTSRTSITLSISPLSAVKTAEPHPTRPLNRKKIPSQENFPPIQIISFARPPHSNITTRRKCTVPFLITTMSRFSA